jgi:dTDP-glucose 4,6-dehydratase
MATLLITGGAGFIGSNLVGHVLNTTTHEVVIVDKLTYASNRAATADRPQVRLVRADIADAAAMREVFHEYKPAAVLNLAAETHVDRSIDSALAFVNTNVVGTLVLLDAARAFVGTMDQKARAAFRFLQVSTDEVYGSLGETGAFTEETPYAPKSPYAASKAGADHLVRAYFATYGLPTLVTNCSNNYGPLQHPEKLIPLMILNALDARPLPVYGDGLNVRDWLHVGDHCAALMLVLENGRPGESYNVGGAHELSNLDLTNQLCDALELLEPAHLNPSMAAAGVARYRDLMQFVADRPGHDRRYAVDATKIRRNLGWEPRQSFGKGLMATVQWYVANRSNVDAGGSGYERGRLGLSSSNDAALSGVR